MCILSLLSTWLLITSLWPALVQEWPHSPARSRRKHPRAAGRPWGCDLAETQLGRARDRSRTRGCWEKLRCLAWEICWQRATRRQGIIHGACFSLSYPGKSVLIALGHQHRLVSSCTREQDFHSYPWPHLLGCGPRLSQRKRQIASTQDGPGQAMTVWEVVIWEMYQLSWASLIAQLVKNPPAMQEHPVRFLGQEDLLEKG